MWMISVPTVKEAKELIVEAQELSKRAGLRVHKFNSNQKEVISSIAPTERAVTTDALGFNPNTTPEGRILGIWWSVANDTFGFNISAKEHPPTRRGLLSVVTSLYDPLSFVVPFTLSGKCILQEMCCRSTGWDDPVPKCLHAWWEEWKDGLQRLKKTFPDVTIPAILAPLLEWNCTISQMPVIPVMAHVPTSDM